MSTSHTFKDTGVVVQIRRVSPLLLIKLRDAFPAPRPPVQEVLFGDEKRLEPNPNHPDYLEALVKHDADMNQRITSLLIRRGCVFELTPEREAEVEELRKFWLETYNHELEGTAAEIYIAYIAIGSDKDLEELLDAILKRSQPTEGAIEQAQARFPGDVQG